MFHQRWWFSGKIGRCHSGIRSIKCLLISDFGQPRVRFPADAFLPSGGLREVGESWFAWPVGPDNLRMCPEGSHVVWFDGKTVRSTGAFFCQPWDFVVQGHQKGRKEGLLDGGLVQASCGCVQKGYLSSEPRAEREGRKLHALWIRR